MGGLSFKVPLSLLLIGSVVFAFGTGAFFITRGLTGDSPRAIAQLRPGAPRQPDIRAARPDFSNKVLYWQTYSYSFDPGSPDSANGQEIVGDIWVKVGPNNKPVASRGTFRFADGSFHQEYLYVDGREIIIFDRSMLPPDAPVQPPNACRQESTLDAATFDKGVDTGEPFYVERGKMAAAGFEPAAAAPTDIPALKRADLPVEAESVLGSAAARDVWRKQTADEGDTVRVTVLEMDSDSGYLRVDWTYERAADGSEITRYRSVKTAIEVFPSEDVPASLFSAETVAAGC